MTYIIIKAVVYTAMFVWALAVGFVYGWLAGFVDSERQWRGIHDQA